MTAPLPRMTAAYTRISTDSQDHEIQQLRIVAEAQHRGWEINGGWYEDVASGVKERPNLDELTRHVQAGHIERVIVYALDRLGRSMIDVTQRLVTFTQHKCSVVSVTQNLDTSTDIGFVVVAVLAYLADAERKAIISRATDGQRRARARGVIIGKSPMLWLPGQREAMIAAMNADPTGNDIEGINRAALAVGAFTYQKGEMRVAPLSKKRLYEWWDRWTAMGLVKRRPNRGSKLEAKEDAKAEAARERLIQRNALLWSPYPLSTEEAKRRARIYRDSGGTPRERKDCKEARKLAPITAEMLAALPRFETTEEAEAELIRVPVPPPGV